MCGQSVVHEVCLWYPGSRIQAALYAELLPVLARTLTHSGARENDVSCGECGTEWSSQEQENTLFPCEG